MAKSVHAKRIYDPLEPGDGYRVLIDHVWPRGISRERARLDEWARELAPSDDLWRWFDHDPARFTEFRGRYRRELAAEHARLEKLRARAQTGRSRFSTPPATASTTTPWCSPSCCARARANLIGLRRSPQTSSMTQGGVVEHLGSQDT